MDNIYSFFLGPHIKYLRNNTRLDGGKPAMMINAYRFESHNSQHKRVLKDDTYAELEGYILYDILNQYISAIEDTGIAYD